MLCDMPVPSLQDISTIYLYHNLVLPSMPPIYVLPVIPLPALSSSLYPHALAAFCLVPLTLSYVAAAPALCLVPYTFSSCLSSMPSSVPAFCLSLLPFYVFFIILLTYLCPSYIK